MTGDTDKPQGEAQAKPVPKGKKAKPGYDKAGRPLRGDARRKPPKRRRKSPTNSHTSAQKIKRALRIAEALEYRIQKYTYAQIGAEMKLDPAEAYRLVDEGIRSIISEPAEQLLEMELSSLDRLESSIFAQAAEGDLACQEGVLKVKAVRYKLLGINAADKVKVDGNVHHSGDVVLNFMPCDANA